MLVEKFGFLRTHPGLRRAAEFLFAHRTAEGDIRGIYGRQHTPNYSAGMIELARDWLREWQADDGSFRVTLLRDRDRNLSYWVSLAICRVFERFYSVSSR